MSGLFASLHASVNALNAHSRSLEIVGKNLANVNNPAYARQRVIYGDRGTVMTPAGAESLGLEALGVEQLRDALLDRQLMREIGLKQSYVAEQSGCQRAQAALGQTIDRLDTTNTSAAAGQKGLAAAVDDFFNAFQSFAASPTDQGEREMLLQKAGILADRFDLAGQRLQQVQTDLGAEISSDAAKINTLLGTLAELNGQIGRFEVNAPGSAVDLRDTRQARLEDLAALLPVDVTDQPGGELRITARDTNGQDVVLVDLAAQRASVSFNGTALQAGNPPVNLALTGGSIQGALSARDGAVQDLRDNLDALAQSIVTSVNGRYNQDGAAGDFFTSAPGHSIAVRSDLTASTIKSGLSDDAGDNTRALAVAALGDGAFTQELSRATAGLGQALARANSRVDDQTSIERLVRSQRDALSSTSMDEEIADLMKFQRAFQASSRVLNTMDELLDVVVNRLGNA